MANSAPTSTPMVGYSDARSTATSAPISSDIPWHLTQPFKRLRKMQGKLKEPLVERRSAEALR
ncbi:hypothetical protein EUX98_g9232 [Antrodiella citrinella]|uniref:Uncharacterized protein n=1 Tax=Antrodiella citrinella TaxID=2447956 RepID=A0A4S4M269_9APHY|nr:hypothetical protein EUX98_g9232 [Antrodiella citrinella]